MDTLLDLLDLVSTAPAGKFPKDARYAVLLAIGEYAPTEIPSARREALVKQLADWYANDPEFRRARGVGLVAAAFGRAGNCHSRGSNPGSVFTGSRVVHAGHHGDADIATETAASPRMK